MKVPAIAIATLLVVACGGSEGGNAADKSVESVAVANSANTAPKVDCTGLPQPAAGKPDILGIQIGMSATQAIRILECSDIGFQGSRSRGFGLPKMPDGEEPAPIIVASAQFDTVTVYTLGAPGKEIVVGVNRRHRYGDKAPLMKDAIAQLQQKYGSGFVEMAREIHNNYQIVNPAGEMLTRQHPDFYGCFGAAGGSDSIYPKCGRSVFFAVIPNGINTSIALEFSVGIGDNLLAEQMRQQYLAAVDAASQAKSNQELENAAANRDQLPAL